MDHGEHAYRLLRQERYVTKKKKLGGPISRVNLLNFSISKVPSKQSTTIPVTTKELGLAQNRIEVAKKREEAMKHIVSHGILQANPLFDCEVLKKQAKYMLTVELEKISQQRTVYLNPYPILKQLYLSTSCHK